MIYNKMRKTSPCHGSGAEPKVFPLRVKSDFCDLRSTLRSAPTDIQPAIKSPLSTPFTCSAYDTISCFPGHCDGSACSQPASGPLRCLWENSKQNG